MKKLLLIILVTCAVIFGQDRIIQKGNTAYLANKLIVKFKSTPQQVTYKNSQVPTTTVAKLNKIGAVSVEKTIRSINEEAVNYDDIERTYVVEYSSPYDPQELSRKLSNTSEIEWAEPWYVYQVSFDPNDPKIIDGTQWYLDIISAQAAWDISTGSEDIVIAINDTGIDWDHPDLAANIWTNSGEIPANGRDDDNNGYVDDYRGWDFGGTAGEGDNDPMEDSPTHGTYVAGFASAVTNNGEGIAAIGYRCKLMAVKTAQQTSGNTNIVYGREGIIYAANNGADVINCSWGGSSYSQALQDAITYATSLGALVVSSADNDNKIEPAYPSAYDGVLSVGGTDPDDVRYGGSNYGATVDVVAPATGGASGLGMYSTWQDDTYTSNASGTSLASPIVAGLAGLVMQKFPNYSPLQVAEQIRVNTDYIDDINPSYAYYLGTGRVNAYKALSNTNSVSIRAEELVYTDLSNGNGVTEPGESFSLGIRFKNYLNSASNVSVTLESRSNYITVTQNSYTISSLSELSETNNYSSPFEFTIANNIPENQDVELLLKFNDGANYNDFQLIRPKFNTTYLTQEGNNIGLTIASQGKIGFNDYGQQPSEGEGLYYKDGANLLFEGALLYGVSETMVMDAAHETYLSSFSQDFNSLIPFSLEVPGSVSDYQGFTSFNDQGASPNIGIETELHSYSFADDEYSDFIILRYLFHNTSDSTLNSFHAGLFFDLDISDFDDDHTTWDTEDHFGYAYDEDPDNSTKVDDFVGVALISDTKYGYRAMSNAGNNPIGGVTLTPTFDENEKWLAIASATTIQDYGPGDIALSVSGGPYTIEPNGYLNVAFAIAGGYSLDEIRTAIENSRILYGQIPTSVELDKGKVPVEFSLSQNYPNPFNPSTKIEFAIPSARQVTLKIYDVLGREVKTLVDDQLGSGIYKVDFNGSKFSSGVYFYKLTAGSFVETKKMMLVK